jgi:hypothetical protein
MPLPPIITLPVTPLTYPFVQILYRDSFSSADATPSKSAADWMTLEYIGSVSDQRGAELLNVKRGCLPDIGSASFRFLYGYFPALTSPTVVAPDLNKKEVRIQARMAAADPWKTIFWGTVYNQEDFVLPGAGIDQVVSQTEKYRVGARTYSVMDGLWRTSKWMMSLSGFLGESGTIVKYSNAYGNPGYNYYDASNGAIFGNKHPTETYTHKGVVLPCHVWQGAYSLTGAANPFVALNKWTERQMVRHAAGSNRPPGEPLFELNSDSASTAFDYATAQQTTPDMAVLDFLARILSRRRGLAAVWLDWTDEVGGELTVFLKCTPLTYADITFTPPTAGSSSETLVGAYNAGRVFAPYSNSIYGVNLLGDQRNIDDTFKQTDAEVNVHDYVETIGERIEVAFTMCLYDGGLDDETAWYYDGLSMEPRYSSANVTYYTSLEQDERMQLRRYYHTFQLFGIPRAWLGTSGDGFNNQWERIDFRCADTGAVVAPGNGNSIPVDTAPGYCELIGSLPFYEGYTYTGTQPAKSDNAEEFGLPSRRPLQVYLRPSGVDSADPGATVAGTDKWYVPFGQFTQTGDNYFGENAGAGDLSNYQPTVTVSPDAILLDDAQTAQAGFRLLADPTEDSTRSILKKLEAMYPMSRVAVSCTVRLPHRMRFCSTTVATSAPGYPSSIKDRSAAKRTKSIYVPGLHLWLASYTCIWDLLQSSYTLDEGFTPLRSALGSTKYNPAILRDDRYLLMRYHELAAAWYTTPRRKVIWGMRYCGFFGFTDAVEGAVKSPQIGDYIKHVFADGQELVTDTVVTSVSYDHQACATTWTTDYFDLEMSL